VPLVRRLAFVAVATLLLVSGCGDDESSSDGGTQTTPATAIDTAVADCLAGRGFALTPSTSGVAAVTPRGVELTIAFFPTADGARAAAAKAGSRATAVDVGVVTPSRRNRLSERELATIRDCFDESKS
jgi:hypothetical protein